MFLSITGCFVKYLLMEQIVFDMVRCYSKNQYHVGIATQIYYNETQIVLNLFEAILKSGNTQPIYLSLVQQRIEAPLAEFASSPV
jgi:hypothetical protein